MLLEELLGKRAEEQAVVQHHIADQPPTALRSVLLDRERRVREGGEGDSKFWQGLKIATLMDIVIPFALGVIFASQSAQAGDVYDGSRDALFNSRRMIVAGTYGLVLATNGLLNLKELSGGSL